MRDDEIPVETFKRLYKVEILMRGKVIRQSARLEVALVQIMLLSDVFDVKAKIIPFKELKYYQKINLAQKKLKKFNPTLYKEHKDVFGELHRLKQFRNRLAHCGLTWNEDFVSFTIWEPEIDKVDKVHYFTQISYTFKDVGENVKKLSTLNKKLELILLQMQLEIGDKDPEFYKLMHHRHTTPP